MICLLCNRNCLEGLIWSSTERGNHSHLQGRCWRLREDNKIPRSDSVCGGQHSCPAQTVLLLVLPCHLSSRNRVGKRLFPMCPVNRCCYSRVFAVIFPIHVSTRYSHTSSRFQILQVCNLLMGACQGCQLQITEAMLLLFKHVLFSVELDSSLCFVSVRVLQRKEVYYEGLSHAIMEA